MKHFDRPNMIFLSSGFSDHFYKYNSYSYLNETVPIFKILTIPSSPLTQAVKMIFLNKPLGLLEFISRILPEIFF